MNEQHNIKETTDMDNFTYQYPVRQHFGKGCAERAIKEEMGRVGRNVLLAYGGGSLKRTGLYDRLRGWLHERGKHVVDFGGIRANPTYAKVQEGARLVREQGIDFILAVGGGSVIDCCKIVSAQARTDEDIWDMMYEAHRLPTEFVPTGAVVTASGTGAEQNNGAVITHTAKRLKQPLVGAYHSFAILDSDLTKTLPMKQVVSGAFDTLSHCMETYMGRPQGDNLSDEINEAVMRSVIKNLRALIANPDDDFLPMPHAGTRRRRLHRLQPRAGAGRHPPRPLPPLAGRGQGEAGAHGRTGVGCEGRHRGTDRHPRHQRHRSLHPRDRHAHPMERNGHHGRGCPSCRCRHLPADARLLQAVYEGRTVRSVKRKYVIKS